MGALMALGLPRMDKAVLLAPAAMARAAAYATQRPEERWLLHQPRPVRTSYVQQVLEPADEPQDIKEVWMLRQPKPVRESYIREVLRDERHNIEEVWMLRQPKPVRESYIREVLRG